MCLLAVKLDLGRKLLWKYPCYLSACVSVVSVAYESELGGCPVHVDMVENISGFFPSNLARVHILGRSLL